MPRSARPAAATPVRAPSALTAACTCGRLRRAARSLTQLYDDAMAPSGLRIWAGATIETADMQKLMPWLSWAFETQKATLSQAVA